MRWRNKPLCSAMCSHWSALEGLVARQQVGLLGEVEGLLRMHGAEFRVQTRLQAGLDGVGHHQVGLAVDDLLEDRHVVRMHQDPGLLQVRPGEFLVGAAGVDNGRHARLVDLLQGLETRFFATEGDRRLAVAQVGNREIRLALALQVDRDAAHGDVEAVVGEIAHQVRPTGRHHYQLGPQALGQALRHVHVEAGVAALFRAVTEGLVVARGGDAQHAAFEDAVEAALLRLEAGAGQQRKAGQGLDEMAE